MNFSLNTRVFGSLGNGLMSREGLRSFSSFAPKLGWTGLNSKESILSRAMSEEIKTAVSSSPFRAKGLADDLSSLKREQSTRDFGLLGDKLVPLEHISKLISPKSINKIEKQYLENNLKVNPTAIHNRSARVISVNGTALLNSPKSGTVERLLFNKRIGHYR